MRRQRLRLVFHGRVVDADMASHATINLPPFFQEELTNLDRVITGLRR